MVGYFPVRDASAALYGVCKSELNAPLPPSGPLSSYPLFPAWNDGGYGPAKLDSASPSPLTASPVGGPVGEEKLGTEFPSGLLTVSP